jgi:hypothetical protein
MLDREPQTITDFDMITVRPAERGGWAVYSHEDNVSTLFSVAADDEGLLEFFAGQLSLPAPTVEWRAVRAALDRHHAAILAALPAAISHDLPGPVPPNPGAQEASAAAMVPPPVSADLVDHMVSRFLSWKLPEGFSPDGGITFTPVMNEGTEYAYRSDPSGTNLFNAEQATAMVRHMLEGGPAVAAPDVGELAAQATSAMLLMTDVRKALAPIEAFVLANRDCTDGVIAAIDKPADAEEYTKVHYGELRAVLRAAGRFTDDMRPSQPAASQDAAADASVEPAEDSTPPPADTDDDGGPF